MSFTTTCIFWQNNFPGVDSNFAYQFSRMSQKSVSGSSSAGPTEIFLSLVLHTDRPVCLAQKHKMIHTLPVVTALEQGTMEALLWDLCIFFTSSSTPSIHGKEDEANIPHTHPGSP